MSKTLPLFTLSDKSRTGLGEGEHSAPIAIPISVKSTLKIVNLFYIDPNGILTGPEQFIILPPEISPHSDSTFYAKLPTPEVSSEPRRNYERSAH